MLKLLLSTEEKVFSTEKINNPQDENFAGLFAAFNIWFFPRPLPKV